MLLKTKSRPNLPTNAPTAGYLCGGAGIMSAGFEMAGILGLWNIDRYPPNTMSNSGQPLKTVQR